MVKTKIIATLGPSSNNETILRKMFISGLDLVRLNFSHGSHPEHLHRVHLARTLNKKMRRAIKIMQDLEGYRIRIGYFKSEGSKILQKKKVVFLTNGPDTGDPRLIPIDYKESLYKIGIGQLIYIDDGNIILKVKQSSKK